MKNILKYILPRALAVVLASLVAYGCAQPGGIDDSVNHSNNHSTTPITITIDNESSVQIGEVDFYFGDGGFFAAYAGYQGSYTYMVPSDVTAVRISGTSLQRDQDTNIQLSSGTVVTGHWEGNSVIITDMLEVH